MAKGPFFVEALGGGGGGGMVLFVERGMVLFVEGGGRLFGGTCSFLGKGKSLLGLIEQCWTRRHSHEVRFPFPGDICKVQLSFVMQRASF